MSGAPIMSGTRKLREAGEDRDDDEEDHPRPVHRDDLVVRVAGDHAAVGLGELRADQERQEPGQREEEPRGADVEDPDPLVVDGDEPARDLAALPGGNGASGVNCQGSAPDTRSTPAFAPRPSRDRPAACRHDPRAGAVSIAAGSSNQRGTRDRRSVATLAVEPMALRAARPPTSPRRAATCLRPAASRVRRATRRTPPAGSTSTEASIFAW